MTRKEAKAAIREFWGQQPGFWSNLDNNYLDATHPTHHQAVHCAVLCGVDRKLFDRAGIHQEVVWKTNDAFQREDGVTPEERRDCMIAMLDEGVFDDFGVWKL